jgi:hypothetical protein
MASLTTGLCPPSNVTALMSADTWRADYTFVHCHNSNHDQRKENNVVVVFVLAYAGNHDILVVIAIIVLLLLLSLCNIANNHKDNNVMAVIILACAGNHSILVVINIVIVVVVIVTPWLWQQWVSVPPPPDAQATDTQWHQCQRTPTQVGSTVVRCCNNSHNRCKEDNVVVVVVLAHTGNHGVLVVVAIAIVIVVALRLWWQWIPAPSLTGWCQCQRTPVPTDYTFLRHQDGNHDRRKEDDIMVVIVLAHAGNHN